MSKPIEFHIERSPYGDTGATYHGMLGMMNHFILQLKSFRSPLKTKAESEYLEADIAGYEEIVRSGREENANEFMLIKRDRRREFANNSEIVAYMKREGIWK